MAKSPKKPQQKQVNPINRVLSDNKTTPKSRQQIYQENYQKNKERKKQQRKQRYQQDKETEKARQKERYKKAKEKKKAQQKLNYAKKKTQSQLSIKQQSAKYYQAEAIKMLMSLKEYTELNKEKHKLYADFCWTLQDCQRGIGDIVAIMKLAQVADNLIRDYWETAKSEIKKGQQSWNLLDYDQQQKLIRYWGYEKARIENGYLNTAEQLEKQSQTYLKDIELAKYHEERGKINCECYACEEQKKVRAEVEAEREKILDEYEKEQKKSRGNEETPVKTDCGNCFEYKKVDPDSGLCKKCEKENE
ncbi:MAG: hypothetical protein MRERV_33c015 [Mycoplasmataceae bacterium RV_VA103A]|nr:MAG: hypothetical protein MRERV_33c015 [Mycoplasmataceae bacterium RV_VA103A]